MAVVTKLYPPHRIQLSDCFFLRAWGNSRMKYKKRLFHVTKKEGLDLKPADFKIRIVHVFDRWLARALNADLVIVVTQPVRPNEP